MRASLLLAVSTALLPAMALAQDDPACARFEEPLAYNACLASHGPKANIGAAPGGGAPRQTDPDSEEPQGRAREVGAGREAPAEPQRRVHGAANVIRRHGRIHMEFRLR